MTRPKQVLIHLTCIAALAWTLPTLAAERDAPVRSPFDGVRALDRAVTLSETKIPLGELVQKVATDTGVLLIAAREVADEPVTVVVRELPARELLEQVAVLLDYRWSRRGREGAWRYEIWQDLAAKQREMALRAERVTAAERWLQEEVRRYVEISRLSEPQRRAIEAEMRGRTRQFERLSPPEIQSLMASGQLAGLWPLVQRAQAAQRLASPITRSLAQLLGQLSPTQWAVIWAGREVVYSSSPADGEAGLPEEISRTFRSTPVTLGEYFSPESPPDHVAEIRQRNAEMQDRWKNAAAYRVTIMGTRRELSSEGSLSLHMRVQPTRLTDAPDHEFFSGEDTHLELTSRPHMEAMEQMFAGVSPERRAEMESDPVLSARKSLPERALGRGPYDPARELQRFLLDLTSTYEIHAIADAYGVRPFSPPVSGGPSDRARPLWQLLNLACGPTHRWDHRGRVVRFRSRTWFLDRPHEIPQRLLREWKDQFDQHGALTLDGWVELGSLRDEQLQNLSNIVHQHGLSHELSVAYRLRHLLRLYRTLTTGQRQALWHGHRLPQAALTPLQRQLLLAGWREYQAGQPEGLDPMSIATVGLSLERQPQRMRERQDGLWLYRDEPVAAAEPAPSPGPAPPEKRPRVTRYPVTSVMLITHYGSSSFGTGITIASPP